MKSAPSMTSPDREAVRVRDPIMLFAQPVAEDPTTLGLERGAALLAGGEALLPSGLPMTIGMEHQPDFVRAVAHACREQILRGRDWYSHGVMALVGSKNAGRGHAARRLATATGLPLNAAASTRSTSPGPDVPPSRSWPLEADGNRSGSRARTRSCNRQGAARLAVTTDPI